MFEKLFKAWGVGMGRSCLIQLAVTAIVVPLSCLCIFAPLALVQNRRFDPTTELLIMVVPMVGFLVVCLGGALGVGGWMLWNNARRLDAAFGPLGLTGRMYLTNGRQYHGTLNGRSVDVYFHRGPTLEIYLGTSVKTRAGVGLKSRLASFAADMLKRQPLTPGPLDETPFTASALDKEWGLAWLTEPGTIAAVQRLLAPAASYTLPQLYLQPEAIVLAYRYMPLDHITAENVQLWLSDLENLARTAEAVPAPATPVATSAMERNNRNNRGAYLLPALGIIAALVIGSLACVGGMIGLIFLLEVKP